MLSQKPIFLEDYRDIPKLDVNGFPCAAGFSVRWSGDTLEFVDESLPLHVGFPWWDRQDLEQVLQSQAGLPLGDVDEPFDDQEQGWRILIWRAAGMVWIMVGAEATFTACFRVPLERYSAQWSALARRLTDEGSSPPTAGR